MRICVRMAQGAAPAAPVADVSGENRPSVREGDGLPFCSPSALSRLALGNKPEPG
jgi:hypothetical protein